MLSQKNRISNQRLIGKLNKEGKVYKTSHFVFKYLSSNLTGSKFATVVSKKNAAKAVDRNRLRRQISESIRLNQDSLRTPLVCLVILKPGQPAPFEYGLIEKQIQEFFNHVSADV